MENCYAPTVHSGNPILPEKIVPTISFSGFIGDIMFQQFRYASTSEITKFSGEYTQSRIQSLIRFQQSVLQLRGLKLKASAYNDIWNPKSLHRGRKPPLYG